MRSADSAATIVTQRSSCGFGSAARQTVHLCLDFSSKAGALAQEVVNLLPQFVWRYGHVVNWLTILSRQIYCDSDHFKHVASDVNALVCQVTQLFSFFDYHSTVLIVVTFPLPLTMLLHLWLFLLAVLVAPTLA